MSLLNEYGDRFNDYFSGAMFVHPDWPDSVFAVEGLVREDDEYTAVQCRKYTGTAMKLARSSEILPSDFFHSLSVFKHPPYGLRSAANGDLLVNFLPVSRSYGRGIHYNALRMDVHPMSRALEHMRQSTAGNLLGNEGCVAMMMFKPEFYSMQEGLALLNAGTHKSFCMNEDVAVVLPPNDGPYQLVYKGMPAGTVDKDGTIRTVTKLILEGGRHG